VFVPCTNFPRRLRLFFSSTHGERQPQTVLVDGRSAGIVRKASLDADLGDEGVEARSDEFRPRHCDVIDEEAA
jgi:hypothetical protein